MNYQRAATEAIKGFNVYRKSPLIHEIEEGAQFRRLTVYESSGTSQQLTHCLFGLEFCDPMGANYREIMICVYLKDGEILRDVRLYTLNNI